MAKTNNNPQVFFDIVVSFKPVGRIVMELFKDTNPLTVENFRALCTGEKGIGESGKPLHYKGSVIHRVSSDWMWGGGDITHGDGSGGESIYGRRFPDENFTRKHDRLGILTMANSGENTNGSQFMIVMTEFPDLDDIHVAFGRVIKGFEVIRCIEKMVGTIEGYPSCPVTITDCGQISPSIFCRQW